MQFGQLNGDVAHAAAACVDEDGFAGLNFRAEQQRFPRGDCDQRQRGCMEVIQHLGLGRRGARIHTNEFRVCAVSDKARRGIDFVARLKTGDRPAKSPHHAADIESQNDGHVPVFGERAPSDFEIYRVERTGVHFEQKVVIAPCRHGLLQKFEHVRRTEFRNNYRSHGGRTLHQV